MTRIASIKTAVKPPAPVVQRKPAATLLRAAPTAGSAEESHDLLQSLALDNERLRRIVAEAEHRIAQLEALSEADTLTAAANRRGIIRELERAQALVRRHGGTASLLFVDVDAMKAINDRYGHAAGDAALVHIAAHLRAGLRATDSLGRIGGDEFLAILPHAEAAQAHNRGAALRDAIRATPVQFGKARIPVSVTIGAAPVLPDAPVVALLDAADRAMYALKPQPVAASFR